MSNYTQQKISFGDRVGADWGDDPWPSLRTSPGWGNCAYVAILQSTLQTLGIYAGPSSLRHIDVQYGVFRDRDDTIRYDGVTCA